MTQEELLELAAERLADFARDDFASTIETNWATMGDERQQYFRNAVAVVREALAASDKEKSVAEEWCAYMDEAVSKAPEPLRKLGEHLAELLDEDQWKTAERYLNAAALATSTDVMKLRGALEPFAAFARAAETVRQFSGGFVSEDAVIQSCSSEAGMGVLVYGHLLDALAAFPGEPRGWNGRYVSLRGREAIFTSDTPNE